MKSQSLLNVCAMLIGLTSLTAAALASPAPAGAPKSAVPGVTNDTAIYDNLSEIKAPRSQPLNVDADLQRLASLEGRFKERLPGTDRVLAPMKRIGAQRYKPSRQQAGKAPTAE